MSADTLTKCGRLDADKLPRTTFTQTHEGCASHGDPTCLCDVNLRMVPTPVRYTPMFGGLADEAVGGVSAETIVDWAEILFGCYDEWLTLDLEDEQPTVHGWQLLPEFNRSQLVKAYKAGIKWSHAKVWVPSGFPAEDMKIVAKTYNVRLYTKGS